MLGRESAGISSIHDGIVPKDVRETDFIHARYRLDGEDADYSQIRIWRISPLGAELVRPETHEGKLLKKGKSLELQLVIEGRRSDFRCAIVDEQNGESGLELLGVRFLVSEDRDKVESVVDTRRAQRWICSEEHVPRAVAPAPGSFNEFIGFKVRDISSKGLLLTTSLDNGFLISGMRLSLSIHLPLVAETYVKVEIVRLRIGTAGAEDILEVGVDMVDPSSHTLALFGQYLVQFSRTSSVEALVAEGLVPRNVSLGMSIYPLKSEADFKEVLQLRKAASEEIGLKFEPSSFAEEQDRKARILVGRLGKNMVVTARVRYPVSGDQLTCEPEFGITESEGRIDQLIEVTAIVVRVPREYYEQILLTLVRYICTSCTSAERQKVLVVSLPSMRGVYEKAGWRRVYADQEKVVLLADAYSAIQGKGVNPVAWNFVWRDVADYLLEIGELKPVGIERIVLRVFRLFGPLSKLIFYLRRMRSNIRRSE